MPFVIVMGNANRQEGWSGGREKERGLQLEPQERSDYYFPELCLSRPYPDKTFAFVAAIVPGRDLGACAGEGWVRKEGGGTCYTCNLCNNASRVFAFAFSKIEAIGPYAYFRTCPTTSTPTPTFLYPCPSLTPPPSGLYCSLSVSTPFLLGVLFLSSPSSYGDTAQSLDICKSLCDAGCRWNGG